LALARAVIGLGSQTHRATRNPNHGWVWLVPHPDTIEAR